jgi:hypothetical protein
MARRSGALRHCLLPSAVRILLAAPAELTGPALASGPCQQRRSRQLSRMAGGKAMCLRCGVVEYPYRSRPSGPAGPGDYGSPPDASPPEYGAAPTGGFFGIGARVATTGWPRAGGTGAARSAGTSSPSCVSSAKEPPEGASPRLDLVPLWVRAWYQLPFIDRYAHAWMWWHGAWEVRPPEMELGHGGGTD